MSSYQQAFNTLHVPLGTAFLAIGLYWLKIHTHDEEEEEKQEPNLFQYIDQITGNKNIITMPVTHSSSPSSSSLTPLPPIYSQQEQQQYYF